VRCNTRWRFCWGFEDSSPATRTSHHYRPSLCQIFGASGCYW
jgi:hypothetical protein